MLKQLRFLFIGALVSGSSYALAQDDLLSLVDDQKDEGPKKVYATFKTLRIGNAQTIETVKKRHLDFRIGHRFGNVYDSDNKNPINETFQSYLGFDGASDIRTSFDYGLTENITLGIGRSRNRLLDGSIKWRVLQQTTDFKMPVSVALFSSLGYYHSKPDDFYQIPGNDRDFKTSELHRLNFFYQVIIASKVTDWLSLEILPGYLHRNYIKERINSNNKAADKNAFFNLGFGGRIKLTKRFSIIGDYFYNFADFYKNNDKVSTPLALGFELETGGHVFSLFYTNASYLVENNYMALTTDKWSKGEIKFGFCISRTFSL